MSPLWEEAFNAFGLQPTESQRRQLLLYTKELLAVNRKMNLVKAADEESLLKQHLFDVLSGLPILGCEGPQTAADVGSGCGLPGIPLAIFWEKTQMTLIERSAKRCSFLQYVVALCGLTHRVTVENRELEQLSQKFETVTFRAFRPFAEFISPLLSITQEGGRVVAFKGKEKVLQNDLHLSKDRFSQFEIKTLSNPFYDAERHLLIIEKI